MTTDLHISAAGATDTGRVRSTNQDAFLVDSRRQLYIVADGMGGHAGGEIASQMCIDEIPKFLSEKRTREALDTRSDERNLQTPALLSKAINYASSKIYERALEEPQLSGMGTTATVVKIDDNMAYWAHVGDSRLYLLRCDLIYQITHDHSLVGEQVRAGLISEEEAEVHQLRNIITRSVGYQEEEEVDCGSFQLKDGDVLVLCSDGLHGKVSDLEISRSAHTEKIESIESLIDLANERGGEDNISVVVIFAKKTESQ